MSKSTIESKIRVLALQLLKSGVDKDDVMKKIRESFKELNKEIQTSLLEKIYIEYDWVKDKTLPNETREYIVQIFNKMNYDFKVLDKRIDSKLNFNIMNILKKDFTQTQIRNAIASTIDTTESIAKTLANTVNSGFSTLDTIKDLDETDELEYIGSGAERPFCKEHLGQILTVAEWKKKENGQNLPVIICKGGYNCQHDFGVV